MSGGHRMSSWSWEPVLADNYSTDASSVPAVIASADCPLSFGGKIDLRVLHHPIQSFGHLCWSVKKTPPRVSPDTAAGEATSSSQWIIIYMWLQYIRSEMKKTCSSAFKVCRTQEEVRGMVKSRHHQVGKSKGLQVIGLGTSLKVKASVPEGRVEYCKDYISGPKKS